MISCVSGTVNIRTGNGTQYSRITAAKNGDTFESLARSLLPLIQKYYESEDGKKAFAELKAKN